MVLQANFVTDPFLYWQGTYNGLFATTNGVTEPTAGMLKGLTIYEKGIGTGMPSQNGTYSGTLLIDGQSHPISGSFDLAGQATNRVSRLASEGGPLTVQMALVTVSNPEPFYLYAELVTGTISGNADGVPWGREFDRLSNGRQFSRG
jgi:hypothetical protein